MIGGFNTNIRYKGRMFHVQTEDSGKANPKIVTLLYEGGVILTSTKSSYQDQIEADNLQSVVRELMEQQHSLMVQSLKDGELDEVVGIAEAKDAAATAKKTAKGSRKTFGEGIVTDRPLDEVVLAHFNS